MHEPKEITWIVAPHIELETDALDIQVTIPQTEHGTMMVTKVEEEGILSCSVDGSRSSPGLMPSCSISYIKTPSLEEDDETQILTAALTVQVCYCLLALLAYSMP